MSIKRYSLILRESNPSGAPAPKVCEDQMGDYVKHDDHVSEIARLMERCMDLGEDVVAYEVKPIGDYCRAEPVGANRMQAMFGPPRSPHEAEDECERLNEAYNLGRKSIMNSEPLDRSSL